MNTAPSAAIYRGRRHALWFPVGLSALVLLLGMIGYGNAAVGYALFLLSVLLILIGLGCFALFSLVPRFTVYMMLDWTKWSLLFGVWTYIVGAMALAGYYGHEVLAGRASVSWIVFGVCITTALLVLDIGIYRFFVSRQLPTWRRYAHVISIGDVEQDAMRRTLIDEVILHRSLLSLSVLRWLRHTLIFWGFSLMFGVELIAVIFREALPAFGFPDVYADHAHPLRAAFTLAFNLTGLMVLAGCFLAIYWRVRVRGTDLVKYTDTPTTLFLLVVTFSGFLVQAYRIAAMDRNPELAVGFIGYLMSFAIPDSAKTNDSVYEVLWLFHMLSACAFIAYVPLWRLIHSCATPIGRLANSQKRMLANKKDASLRGLLS